MRTSWRVQDEQRITVRHSSTVNARPFTMAHPADPARRGRSGVPSRFGERLRVVSYPLMVMFVTVALSANATPPSVASRQPTTKGTSAPTEAQAQLATLPPVVRATVEAELRGATLKGVAKEREGGRTVYELESIVAGRTRDVMIDSTGKVYLVEEEVDVAAAPPAVRAALAARGRIVKVEAVTTKGRTYYEGHLEGKGGKSIAVEVDADGKPIK